MEVFEELLNAVINYSDIKTSNSIVFGIKWLSAHYGYFLDIVRITVPCVLLSMTLFCLLASSSEVTE